MKTYIGQSLLIVFFVALSLTLPFYLVQRQNKSMAQILESKKQVLGVESQNESKALPVRLIIPNINVNATVKDVGVTSKGIMGVPKNAMDAGWFNLGPRPGEMGSAVIAGHLNGESGQEAVFTNLNKLVKGDQLYVENDKGEIFTFVVRESRIYGLGYADDVFSRNDGVHLNLVTCDGVWDGGIKSYSKRLVVFSDITI